LVGGQLPADVLDLLMAGLADQSTGCGPQRRLPPPAAIASLGAVAVLVLLLTAMALLGLVL
jgi:hypothetical protein